MKDYLTTSQVARRLGLSADRVRQLARADHISYVRVGTGLRLFPGAKVEQLARERAEKRRRSRRYPRMFRRGRHGASHCDENGNRQ